MNTTTGIIKPFSCSISEKVCSNTAIILTSTIVIISGCLQSPNIQPQNTEDRIIKSDSEYSINAYKNDTVFEDVDMNYRLCLEQINEIKNLRDNWNGNGAPAFSNELIERVKRITKNLISTPDILPTAEDSIQLEYENSSDEYLEIEIFENGQIRLFSATGDDKFRTEFISEDRIDEEVRHFYGL